jgi:hypothetical protein
VPAGVEINPYPLRGLGVDRKRMAPAALADDAQRVISAILMEVSDLERGYLRRERDDVGV